MASTDGWSMGIEEEYQIVDASTRALRPRGRSVLSGAQAELGETVQPELLLSQVEVASPVCGTLADVRAAVVRARRGVIDAAEAQGCKIAAAGTHPFSDWHDQPVTPKERYRRLLADFRQLAREQVIFGCHVHVGLADREAAIEVSNRARVWLTPLLALAANSPYWLEEDTGYASYRTALWSRWPLSGPPQTFGSLAEYRSLVETLVSTGDLEDATRVYWDLRIPDKTDTIEFRVTDVCLSVDEAVMIAGLIRALTRTCFGEAERGDASPAVRQEVLRVAHWHASRYGLEAELIDVVAGVPVPAAEFVGAFLAYVREALEATGDWEEVSSLVATTLRRGNGAMRQRTAFEQAGRWEDVVDLVIEETSRGA